MSRMNKILLALLALHHGPPQANQSSFILTGKLLGDDLKILPRFIDYRLLDSGAQAEDNLRLARICLHSWCTSARDV